MSKALAIILFLSISLSMAACGNTSLEPVSADSVKFMQDKDERVLDVTKTISANNFIALKDYIIQNGEIAQQSKFSIYNRSVPTVFFPSSNDSKCRFTIFEGRLEYDVILIEPTIDDTLDCSEYDLRYYTNGIDATALDIENYIDGHVYAIIYCDTGITNKQLMRQLDYYYSLLIEKN